MDMGEPFYLAVLRSTEGPIMLQRLARHSPTLLDSAMVAMRHQVPPGYLRNGL
jgi:hypothetical protein